MFKNQDNQNNICFIRTENGYEQITYAELCKRRNTIEEYKSKKFLPLHRMLMEVTEEQYKEFYRQKRRQKYINERSAENGDFSYDMLTTGAFNGEDILVDESEPLDEQVVRKIMTDKLRCALRLLSEDEQELIYRLFYENLSEREYAAQKGVYHNAIHNKKIRILKKLKKFLDN